MFGRGHAFSSRKEFSAHQKLFMTGPRWSKIHIFCEPLSHQMHFSGKHRRRYWTDCNRDAFSLIFTEVDFKSGHSAAEWRGHHARFASGLEGKRRATTLRGGLKQNILKHGFNNLFLGPPEQR